MLPFLHAISTNDRASKVGVKGDQSREIFASQWMDSTGETSEDRQVRGRSLLELTHCDGTTAKNQLFRRSVHALGAIEMPAKVGRGRIGKLNDADEIGELCQHTPIPKIPGAFNGMNARTLRYPAARRRRRGPSLAFCALQRVGPYHGSPRNRDVKTGSSGLAPGIRRMIKSRSAVLLPVLFALEGDAKAITFHLTCARCLATW